MLHRLEVVERGASLLPIVTVSLVAEVRELCQGSLRDLHNLGV